MPGPAPTEQGESTQSATGLPGKKNISAPTSGWPKRPFSPGSRPLGRMRGAELGSSLCYDHDLGNRHQPDVVADAWVVSMKSGGPVGTWERQVVRQGFRETFSSDLMKENSASRRFRTTTTAKCPSSVSNMPDPSSWKLEMGVWVLKVGMGWVAEADLPVRRA